jgi:hypothetical protein
MKGLIEGYSCDIFISYRQNDNLAGWVSEFVAALKDEFAVTFKEPVSVYFDTSLQDGLLESHNVTKSLESRIKSLVFVPIISQTYCDSNCFAWQNEFRVFNKIAREDSFGRDITLLNGNIASRILPVKIHELDPSDTTLLEEELGGALRSIDFIFKSSGVNRPLSAREDHLGDNQNRTYYRDQINKVANAVKEIIYAMKAKNDIIPGTDTTPLEKSAITALAGGNVFKRRIAAYMRRNLVLPASVLLIPLALFTALNIGNFQVKESAEEVLEKAVETCDFFRKWDNYNGKITLRTVFDNGNHSDEIIEIQTKDGFYMSDFTSGSLTCFKGIRNDLCFCSINGNNNPNSEELHRYNLGCDRIRYMKELHYCRFGLLMELRKSGLRLQKKVERKEFQGTKCIALTFLSPDYAVPDSYFHGLNYVVYLDPDDYSLKGARWYGRFNAYIVFSGFLNINGIKVPVCCAYFNSGDNSLKFIDLVSAAD